MDSDTSQNVHDPQNEARARRVLRVTWIGLAVNVALGLVKFLAGLFGSSQALVADAVHTLSDISTDLAILVGVRYWSQPADEDHPHGHARIETVVTSIIGIVLAASGIGLAYRALATLADQELAPPRSIAIAAALLSIITKEVLYRWTVGIGRRIRSPAMVANAWHHRSDAFSSIPVVLAVGGAMIYPAWSFLDHIGAIVVSLFLLGAAWRIGTPALKQLIDVGAPRTSRKLINDIVMATPDVKRVHAIRTRYLGPGLEVDLHIWVDADMTVRKGHDISEAVKKRLMEEGPDVLDVVVHIEPAPTDESSNDKQGQPRA